MDKIGIAEWTWEQSEPKRIFNIDKIDFENKIVSLTSFYQEKPDEKFGHEISLERFLEDFHIFKLNKEYMEIFKEKLPEYCRVMTEIDLKVQSLKCSIEILKEELKKEERRQKRFEHLQYGSWKIIERRIKMDKLKFGTAIEFSGKVVYCKNYSNNQRSIWAYEFKEPKFKFETPMTGVIIGKSRLFSGITDYDPDEGYRFNFEKSIWAYQVKIGEWNKIINVLPGQIKKIIPAEEFKMPGIRMHLDLNFDKKEKII